MKMKTFAIVFLMIVVMHISGSNKDLKDYYKDGKLILKEQMSISLDSVPGDIGFKEISNYIVLENGNIFISDMSFHNLKMFDKNGKFLKIIGRKGTGPGDLSWPGTLCYNGKYLIVWEIGNQRFSLFTKEGNFVKIVKMKARMMVLSMKALKNGNIIVENQKYNFGKNIGQECVLKSFSKEMVFKKDIYNHDILSNKFIKKPVRTNIVQPFQPGVAWDIINEEKLVIGYSDKYEISFFNSNGKKESSFTNKYKRIKITKKDKEEFFNSLTFSDSSGRSKKGAPSYVKDNTSFPSYKPAYKYIKTDYQSNILVFSKKMVLFLMFLIAKGNLLIR